MKTAGIITGVLMVILGFCSIFMPMRTFLGIGWLVGTLILIYGIQQIIDGVKHKEKRVTHILLGVLGAAVGALILFNGAQRLLTDIMLAYIIGGYILISGIFQIVFGCKLYKVDKGSGVLKIICGVIGIIAGLVSLAHPVLTMFSVGYIIAFTLISQGISILILAFGTKKTSV